MKPLPDRKKLRRDYLSQKRSKYVDAAVSIAIMMPGVILLLLFLWSSRWWDSFEHWGTGLLFMACLALASWTAVTRVRRAQTEARHIPFVPPVTPDTLPADEILVRSSEEPPAAQSETLLRAAQQEQETPQEELLRVSQE